MASKKFNNQGKSQILKHLEHLLNSSASYNLFVDPLGIYLEIKESLGKRKKMSVKREKLKSESNHLSKGKRKRISTNKRTRPKIRTVKKGRTVKLKGIVY